MKKMILLILAGIALFAFIFATSILWYRFFYSSPSDVTTSINVQLSDSNNVIE